MPYVQYMRIEVADTEEGKKFLQRIRDFCNEQPDKNAVKIQIISGSGQSADW